MLKKQLKIDQYGTISNPAPEDANDMKKISSKQKLAAKKKRKAARKARKKK